MSISKVMKVLSDDQRRRILEMLREGRASAGTIAERLGTSPAALSYHLRLLREAGLVTEYREKNFIYYELDTTVFQELIVWIGSLGGAQNAENRPFDGDSDDDGDGAGDPVHA